MYGDFSGQRPRLTFLQASTRKLFFGRDPLGRRSLLINRPSAESPRLLLASVSVGQHSSYSLDELPTGNLFYLDLELLGDKDVSDLV